LSSNAEREFRRRLPSWPKSDFANRGRGLWARAKSPVVDGELVDILREAIEEMGHTRAGLVEISSGANEFRASRPSAERF